MSLVSRVRNAVSRVGNVARNAVKSVTGSTNNASAAATSRPATIRFNVQSGIPSNTVSRTGGATTPAVINRNTGQGTQGFSGSAMSSNQSTARPNSSSINQSSISNSSGVMGATTAIAAPRSNASANRSAQRNALSVKNSSVFEGLNSATGGRLAESAVEKPLGTAANPYVSAMTFGGKPGIERTSFSGTGIQSNEGIANEALRKKQAQDEALRAAYSAPVMDSAAMDTTPTTINEMSNEDPYTEEEKRQEREMKRLQDQLAEVQAPTQEEIDAQQQLDNLVASKELGIQGVTEQPIAQGFITGQATAIERAVANKALPLQARLAALQAKRKAAIDAAKARAGIVDSNLSTIATKRKDRQEQNRYNQTREDKLREQEYQFAKDQEASRYQTIGDGTLLFDTLTGRVIANNPKTFAPVQNDSGNPFLIK